MSTQKYIDDEYGNDLDNNKQIQKGESEENMDSDKKISAIENKNEGKGKACDDVVNNNKEEQITYIRHEPKTEEKEKETFEITSGIAENV